MTNRDIYLVPKKHLVRDVVAEYEREAKKAVRNWKKIAKQFGSGSFTYTSGYGRLLGFAFRHEEREAIPDFHELWVYKRKEGMHTPRKKSNPEQYKIFSEALRGPGAHFVSDKLDTGLVFTGISIALPTIEEMGDRMVLKLHPDHKVPKGVRKVKTSTYYKWKEAEVDTPT